MFKRTDIETTRYQDGFTLVELLIGIAISSVVLAATYTVFNAQQKAYSTQTDVVDIQQSLRAGMYYLEREIRLAAYDPESLFPVAGIVQAGPGIFRFTMDIYDGVDDDGDGILYYDPDEVGFNDGFISSPGEEIIYALADDADEDGFPDTLTGGATPEPNVLERRDLFGTGVADTIVENVEAIAFAYAYDDDNDGFLDQNGGNTIWAIDTDNDQWLDTILDTDFDGDIDAADTAGGDPLSPSFIHVDSIRMIQVWMLVRSPEPNNAYVTQESYVIGDKRLTVNDNFLRRMMSASIVCRNMGS